MLAALKSWDVLELEYQVLVVLHELDWIVEAFERTRLVVTLLVSGMTRLDEK